MGQIITFFSYKGGVGRTMTLANVAVLLAQWGYKTLIVDWDLEAPGLENFFKEENILGNITEKKGVIDIITDIYKKPRSSLKLKWQDELLQIATPNSTNSINLLMAGQKNLNYFEKVRNFDVKNFYKEKEGGGFIENLRDEWKKSFDFILVDSRTGITDIGGICTIQLPDMLVLLFTATNQSLKGIIEVASKAQQARQNMPFERHSILSLPIPSRFDTQTEFLISQEWLDRFASELKNIYDDWLPTTVKPRDILEISKIPYVSYFSFGEKLPVIKPGTNDPAGLGYAFETLAALIVNKLEFIELLIENRDNFIKIATKETSRPKSRTAVKVKPSSRYFPNFFYDIFISYSSVDDKSAFDEAEGWVTKFHKSLEILLQSRFNQKIKIWRASSPESGQIIDQTIKDKIENSALFLALTSASYVRKEYCLQELKWFYQKAKNEPYGLQIGGHSRIINVLLNNVPCDNWPKEFSRILAHTFYEIENEDELGWRLDRNNIDFQKQLKKLVDYIYQTLIEFKKIISAANGNGKENLATPNKEEKIRIFFADVSETLRQTRTLAINKLNQKGFSCVTNIPPPYNSLDHQNRTISEIKNSILSVHLLDEFPGDEIENEPGITYRQKQLEIGKEHAKSQLIWVPKDLDVQAIENDNHRNLLRSLEQEDRPRSGYEFIKGSKALLADEIIAKVEQLQPQSKTHEIPVAVLIDTSLKDQIYAIDLCQFIIERNMQPIILPQLDNPQTNLGVFEHWLKQVNAFIILFGQAHESWVRERLSWAIKLSITKQLPVKFFVIFIAPIEREKIQTTFDFGSVHVELIDNSKSDKPDLKLLEPALQKMIGES